LHAQMAAGTLPSGNAVVLVNAGSAEDGARR